METKVDGPRFKVGQKVNAIAFVNCFGESVPGRGGLTVETSKRHDYRDGSYSYYRILAVEANGFGCVEGAERFFEPA